MMSTQSRPAHMPEPFAAVYDWLAANGVDEWLPLDPDITVAGGKLTYQSYVWTGPRGWDGKHTAPPQGPRSDPPTERRTVPLLTPLTDEVRTAILACGGRLIEPRAWDEAAVAELVDALRLTVEYIGTEALPPKPGWSWFDALRKYAPAVAERFAREHEQRTAPREVAG